MRLLNIGTAVFALFALTACDQGAKQAVDNATDTLSTKIDVATDTLKAAMNMDGDKTAVATLEPKNDSELNGKVTFTEKDGKVTMQADIHGVAEGEHAIHIHAVGDCSSADGKSAGGHWNPTDQPHAKWGAAEGYHKGDIGNFVADADGHGILTFTTDEWCVGCADSTKNVVGHSIIIHDGVDDFTSQPSGAAGTRIGCGVIEMN